jgi:hypothetical protein
VYVRKKLGYDPAHTFACGDSGNDILMLSGPSLLCVSRSLLFFSRSLLCVVATSILCVSRSLLFFSILMLSGPSLSLSRLSLSLSHPPPLLP